MRLLLFLLNERIIEVPSKLISLYPQISTALRPHQKSIFAQWTAGKPESTKVQRIRVTRPQVAHLYHTLSPQGSGTIAEEGMEVLLRARDQEGPE